MILLKFNVIYTRIELRTPYIIRHCLLWAKPDGFTFGTTPKDFLLLDISMYI